MTTLVYYILSQSSLRPSFTVERIFSTLESCLVEQLDDQAMYQIRKNKEANIFDKYIDLNVKKSLMF